MNERKQDLIEKALETYATIVPCATKKTLMDSFSVVAGNLVFWFNTPNGTTRAVWEKMPDAA